MKKGGDGGESTRTGLVFEMGTDLATAISQAPGFEVSEGEVLLSGRTVARLVPKKKLYSTLLRPMGVEPRKLLSRLLEPDEALFVIRTRRVHIVEKKYQQVGGSVDEKLQTCHFKLRQYSKLMHAGGLKVTYNYLLGDWFERPEYRDTLDYIRDVGARYYFGSIPLADLDL